jgi:hypothetical protein
MMQSHFYVFLAVGKLLFGRHEHGQAMQFASGMVGAKPLVVKEAPVSQKPAFRFLIVGLARPPAGLSR